VLQQKSFFLFLIIGSGWVKKFGPMYASLGQIIRVRVDRKGQGFEWPELSPSPLEWGPQRNVFEFSSKNARFYAIMLRKTVLEARNNRDRGEA